MKLRKRKRISGTPKRKQRAQRLALLKQFLREHTWGVMIAGLILIAVVLFIFVIAGASPKTADETQTAQTDTPRYESGYICAITTEVPYYDEDLSQSGTVARGMEVTYATDKTVRQDGVTYYMTYFPTLGHGYVSEENLTQNVHEVIAEKTVYVRTPQNLRPEKDSYVLGSLVEQGTELQVLDYEGTTNGVVDLYKVSYQGETGYISGQYVATTPEAANEVYDRARRHEAAIVEAAGKHEPKISENGIPSDVLDKLLPGDEVIELNEPIVAGGLIYRFVKRVFDVISCGCALIILSIPMAIIALKIKVESPGPVIYAQKRVGKNGRVFSVYKFRSMYVDAEARGAQWAQGDDPRVTPFGKVMRRTRMDEIPQFWNVFKGDMSLIGPRPERPAFCEEFEKRIHGWHYRTLVTPGLSGLAQVMGGYNLLPKEKVVLDLGYIEHRSIAMDLKIILKTLGVVSTGEGAR